MPYHESETNYPEGGEWQQIASTYGIIPEWALAIEAAANEAGGSGMHLARVIQHESRFNTRAQYGRSPGQPFSPGRATGLIQFTPIAAEALGVDLAEVFEMDFMEQMELVAEYLKLVMQGKAGGGVGPLDTQEKMALAVFYPGWRNKPLDTPLPEKVAETNKVKTIGEYVSKVLGEAPPSAGLGGAGSGGRLAVGGALLAGALLWAICSE